MAATRSSATGRRSIFNNNWWYDVGIGQDLAKGVVNLSVFFEEYRALVPGLANARDLLTAVSVKGASGWRVQVSGELGLSDGAPDRGFTLRREQAVLSFGSDDTRRRSLRRRGARSGVTATATARRLAC